MVRRGSRRWSDAVPALVTKVCQAADALPTVDLVIPNLLSLRFGFGSAKPFFEMIDVGLKELRAYTGGERSKLKEQLLKAIRLDCRTRCASQSDKLIITAKRPRTLPLSAPLPLPPQERDVAAGATLDDAGWEFLRHFDPADFAEEPASELVSAAVAMANYGTKDGQGSHPRQEIQPQEKREAVFLSEADPTMPCRQQVVRQGTPSEPPEESMSELVSAAAVGYDTEEGQGSHLRQEIQPQEKQEAVFLSQADPTTPCRRQVERQVTPPEPPAPSDSLKKHPSVINQLPHKARSRPRDSSWLLEFTCAVSRAFRQAKEEELSQQELSDLIAKASGVNWSSEELQEGLRALDSQNKVFLSGDLVFLI